MNTNPQDNPLYFFVHLFKHVIGVLEGILIATFDGLRDTTTHASPSLYSLVAVVLPYCIPLPVAVMTAASAQKFFGWPAWAAAVLGFGLEGLGLLAWVKLVDAILDTMHSSNQKLTTMVVVYAFTAMAYEGLLLSINVVLAVRDGASTEYATVLALICLLPMLSAVIYGDNKNRSEKTLLAERDEQKQLAERIRQEQREDRKEARAQRLAVQQQHQQYAAGTSRPTIELKEGMEPFRGLKPFPHQDHGPVDDEQPRKRKR